VSISGGRIVIEDQTVINSGSKIQVLDHLVIGKKSIIGQGTKIRGRRITLGREFYSVGSLEVGGGSCLEQQSELKAGYWFHAGRGTFINTARLVEIGDEVGIGGYSNLYTHGAYLNVLNGFPEQWGEIHIGDNVWMPNATVHPGIYIGSNTVIGDGSVVTRDIPSNCFAAGVPCKVIRENCYPKPLDKISAVNKLHEILSGYESDYSQVEVTEEGTIVFRGTVFDPFKKTITGNVTKETELLRDRLRRHGIRFKIDVLEGKYVDWSSQV
jgi:acetyltransferase-like isoleucine patch superfamily enzyme